MATIEMLREHRVVFDINVTAVKGSPACLPVVRPRTQSGYDHPGDPTAP